MSILKSSRIQDIMNGKECLDAEEWRIAVVQFGEELQQLLQSDVPHDDVFVSEVLNCSEVHLRLEINAGKISVNPSKVAEWATAYEWLRKVRGLAASADRKFWEILSKRLEEKGLKEQETDEFPAYRPE